MRDLKKIGLKANDAVVGIAASGTTPYVAAAIAYANKCKALTVGLSSNKNSPVERTAKIAITPETGSEILTGSTRLKAGSAQKDGPDMLSTATMVRLGYVYDNLMIDLGVANAKLRKRAKEILEDASARDASAV